MRFATKLLLVIALMSVGTEVAAQETPPTPLEAELRRMAADAPRAGEAERQAVLSFLDRSDVRTTAETRGIDLQTARDGVETLEGEALSDLARRVRVTEHDLDQVGGDTFIISSTAVIIALLVIILVIVA